MSLARRTLLRQPLFTNHASQLRSQPHTSLGLHRSWTSRLSPQSRLQSTVGAPLGHEPPKRSIISRLFRSAVGASFFLCVGMYLGWELFPSKPSLSALLSKWPTDEETNQLYVPPDASSAMINTRVLHHSLAESMRANADFLESRPHMKIPEPLRKVNLTGGTLAGPGRIVVPPVQFVEKGGKSLVSILYLGEQLCGHPGIVHGGLLATLLDEGLARCCFPALPNGIAVTANLKIDYRKPVKADGYYVLRARTERVDGRKAWVKGWIEPLSDDPELGVTGQGGDTNASQVEPKEPMKLVEAEALFIEPKNAGVIKRIYTP